MSSKRNEDDHWAEHSASSTKNNWTDSNKNSLDNDIEQFSKTTGGGGCILSVLSVLAIMAAAVLFPLLLLQ